MADFRQGDLVRCVDARKSQLKQGAVYRVDSVGATMVAIDAFRGPYPGFHKFRFRPLPNIDSLRALLNVQPAPERAFHGD